MFDLTDTTATVTGAARGIGRALVTELVGKGCTVAAVDIDADGLRSLHEELGEAVSVHTTDVSDAAQVERLAHDVIDTHGSVQLLVNNAGVAVHGPFVEQSLEDIEWIVGVNFWGTVHGCKLFLPHLLTQPRAHIVNISSVFGLVGVPTMSTYCATKYAVRGLTEALWEELEGTTVGVTCVHPGGVDTGIIRSARTHDEEERSTVAAYFERHGAPPQSVARRIVRAVERGERRVRIRSEAFSIDWLKRIAPVAGNRWLCRSIARQMGLPQDGEDR